MSCWVVPTLAAEYLGTTLDEVQFRIRTGAIPSKKENGFTFVDVAPHSPNIDDQRNGVRAIPPKTYVEVTVTREELLALTDAEGDEELSGEEAEVLVSAADVPQWNAVRQASSQLRRRLAA